MLVSTKIGAVHMVGVLTWCSGSPVSDRAAVAVRERSGRREEKQRRKVGEEGDRDRVGESGRWPRLRAED